MIKGILFVNPELSVSNCSLSEKTKYMEALLFKKAGLSITLCMKALLRKELQFETLRDCRFYRICGVIRCFAYLSIAKHLLPCIFGKLDNRSTQVNEKRDREKGEKQIRIEWPFCCPLWYKEKLWGAQSPAFYPATSHPDE